MKRKTYHSRRFRITITAFGKSIGEPKVQKFNAVQENCKFVTKQVLIYWRVIRLCRLFN